MLLLVFLGSLTLLIADSAIVDVHATSHDDFRPHLSIDLPGAHSPSNFANVTNVDTIPFIIDFGEPVKRFDINDIVVRIESARGHLTLSRIQNLSPQPPSLTATSYTFDVTGFNHADVVRVSLTASSVSTLDSQSNRNAIGTRILIDQLAPTLVAAHAENPTSVVLAMSERVFTSGISLADFQITGVASNPTITALDVSHTAVVLALSAPMSDFDTPLISYTANTLAVALPLVTSNIPYIPVSNRIVDILGQPLESFRDEPILYRDVNTIAPNLDLKINNFNNIQNPTNLTSIPFLVSANEFVTGFDASDITITSGTLENFRFAGYNPHLVQVFEEPRRQFDRNNYGFDGVYVNDVNRLVYGTNPSHRTVYEYYEHGPFLGTFDGDRRTLFIGSVAIDTLRNVLYVSDLGNDSVVMFNYTNHRIGEITGTGDSRLSDPNDLVMNSMNDKLYVTDWGNDRIVIFDRTGGYIDSFGGLGMGDGQFTDIHDIELDSADNIYVVDGTSRVQIFDSNGNFIRKFTAPAAITARGISGIAVDANNNIYLSIPDRDRIDVYDNNGMYLYQFQGHGDEYFEPMDIEVSASGKIYLVDRGNYRIQVYYMHDTFYRFDVVNPTDPNTLNVTLSANSAHDHDANGNAESKVSLDIDRVAPIPLISTDIVSPTNDDPLLFTVRFNEYVTGFDASDISHTSGTIQNFTYGDISYFKNVGEPPVDSSGILTYEPSDITIGLDGKIYVIDDDNNRVHMFNSDGTHESQFALPDFLGDDESPKPFGIAIGPNDAKIYVTDNNNDRVLVYDKFGEYLWKFGESGNGTAQFDGPQGITVGPDGRIYVVDTENQRIQIFNNGGSYLSQFGEHGIEDGQFNNPLYIALASDGKIYVSEFANGRISIFNNDGTFNSTIEICGTSQNFFSTFTGITIAPDGKFYAIDHTNRRVCVFDEDSTLLQTFGGSGSGEGQFVFTSGIALDSYGTIYVSDPIAKRIQTFSQSSEYSFKISNPADQSTLIVSVPVNVAQDAARNGNVMSNTISLDIDRTPPTVSSQSATSAITVELGTSEPVYAGGGGGGGISSVDFTISGVATATVTAVEFINNTSTITLTLSAPIKGSDIPLVSYTPGTTRITDAAGNQLAAFSNESIDNNFDLTIPMVNISTIVPSHTPLLTIPFTLQLSEPVTGFVISDITTTAGTIQNLSPEPSQTDTSYTFDISGLVDTDNLVVSVAAGAVTDADDNVNNAFSTEPITIDTTAPTVSSQFATSAITVELGTTEPVYGIAITPTDFTISGVATATVTTVEIINDTNTITLTLSAPITEPDTPLISYTPGTNRITDVAGNQLAAFTEESITDDFDLTMPVITITTNATDLTNLTTIPFTLEFTEQVTGFVIGDITTTVGTVQNLSPAPSQSVILYTFDVTGLADEDSLVVSIAAGAVTDADNNLNNAFSTEPITIDTTAPTVSSQSATTATTVELGTTEPVYGTVITPTDFTISGIATSPTVTAVELTNDTNTIILTLSAPITEPDTPLVSYTPGTNRITDAAGNQLAAFTEESITDNFDPTMPIVTISTVVTSPTNLTTIPFTLEFTEQVTGFVIHDIETTAGLALNLSLASSPSDTSYTFDVAGLVDGGNLVVSIAAGAVSDADNNVNDAFSTEPITIDTTAPTVSSQSATSAITVELGTTEPVYGTAITPTDFTISGIATSPTVTAVEITNDTSTIILTLSAPITEPDTPLVSYTPGTNRITDAAGNQLAAFTEESITNNFDLTMPVVTITTDVTGPTTLLTIPFTLQLSEQVTGFVIGDIATTAGTVQNLSPEPSQNDTSYTFDVSGLADTDNLVVSIAAGAVTDADDNLNDAFSTESIIIDTTAPEVSSQSAKFATIVELGTTEPVYGTDITPGDFTISGVVTSPTVIAIDLINGSRTIILTLSAPITKPDIPFVSYTPSTNRITDAAGNQLAAFSKESIIDNFSAPPTVSSASTVNRLTVSLVMSESIFANNVTPSDFTISGVDSNPTVDNVIINNGTSIITLRLSDRITVSDTNPLVSYNVGSNYIFNVATNPLVSFDNYNIDNTLDTTPPAVTIATDISSPTNVDPIPFTARFSEQVTGFDAGDITKSSGTIQNFTSSDIITIRPQVVGGFGIQKDSPFDNPYGIAVSSMDRIYVSDLTNNSIQIFNSIGQYVGQFGAEFGGIGGNKDGQLSSPAGIAIDSNDNIYVADSNNSRVQIFTSDGTYLDQFGAFGIGNGEFREPVDIAINSTGHIYVADRIRNIISIFSNDGTYQSHFGGDGGGDYEFRNLRSITIDSSDNLYVSDTANHRISIFSNDGTYQRHLGSHGTGDGQFDRPNGIAIDSSDNIYVSDTNNDRVQIFSNDGTYKKQLGGIINGTGDGQFNAPRHIALDSDGSVYVVDSINDRIQKFSTSSQITYTFEVSGSTNQDTLTVSIPADISEDGDGNTNSASNAVSLDVDRVAPTILSATTTNTTSVTLVISETLQSGTSMTPSGFTIAGVSISTTTVTAVDISGSTITLTLSDAVSDTDTPSLTYATDPNNPIADAAGNLLVAFSNFGITHTLDTTMPAVTISTDVTDPTNLGTIPFTLQLSEQVTGFVIGDITTTAGTVQNLSPEPSQTATSYTFDVSGLVNEDSLVVSIAAGAVSDADNNLNAAFSTAPITIDTIAPTVSSRSATTATTVEIGITEPVYGNTITPTDFTISGVATSTTVTAVELIDGSSTITLTLSALILGSDTPLVSYTPGTNRITDAAGNQLAAFINEPIPNNFDLTIPVVTISTVVPSHTTLFTIPFTLQLSEQVTGFDIGDIATTAGTVRNLFPEPSQFITSYTFDVSGLADTDNLVVSIAAGAVTDVDNNVNNAFSTAPITIDTTAPTVSSRSATSATTVELGITEPVYGNTITPTDFTISGVATGATVTAVELIDGSSTITLTLSALITEPDTPLVSYTPGTNRITDAAGNQLAAFTEESITDNFDLTMPVVTITTDVTGSTSLLTIPFTLQFSEQVTGFDIGDIATTEGTVQNLSPEPSQTVTSYTFDVSRLADEDSLVVSIAAGAVTDADNNINNAFNTRSIIIDTTAPTVSFQFATSATTVKLRITEPVYGTAITPTDFTISDVATSPTVTAIELIDNTNTITLTLSAPITDSDTPLTSYTPGTNRITDAAGNQLAAFSNESITDNIDSTPPTVSSASTVNRLTVLLVMSEPIFANKVTPGDFTISGVNSNPTVDNAIINNGTNIITLRLTDRITVSDINPLVSYNMGSNFILNAATNPLASFDNYNIDNTLDSTPPAVTITTDISSPTNVDPIPFTARFNELVTGFDAGDIAKSSGTIQNFVGSEIVTSHQQAVGGFGIQKDGLFDNPYGIAISSTDHIYVSDLTNNRIQIFDSNGQYVDQFGAEFGGKGGGKDGQFFNPAGIAIDSNDNIYVADSKNSRVQIFTSDGTYLNKFEGFNSGVDGFRQPIDIAINSTGHIYVADRLYSSILIFNSDLVYQSHFGDFGRGNYEFRNPNSIAIDSNDNLYVSDYGNNRISIFDNDSTYQRQFGSNGTGDGQFDLPHGIAIDSNDNIYVSDIRNDRVQIFSNNGTYQGQFGGVINGTGDGQFNYPRHIALDSDGSVYVVDSINDRFQKFSSSSQITYTFEVSGSTDQGTLTVSIPANISQDRDGNGNSASNAVSLDVDRVPPTILSATTANTTSVTLVISETLPSGTSMTPSGFTIADVSIPTTTVTAVDISGSTITLTLSDAITDADTPSLTYVTDPNNPIADATGNLLVAFSNFGITNTVDTTMPTVTISTVVTDPTNLGTIPFTLQFNEQVTGFVIGDITTTAGTVQNLSPEPSQTVTSYTFDVSGLVNEDSLVVSIAAGAVADADNNLNDAFSTEPITIDTTAPTISSQSATTAITVQLGTTEPVYGTVITPADFTISGIATGATVTAVEIINDTSTITLTLSAPITDPDTPLISYIPGTNRITDAAGNQLAAFTEESITDNFDPTMPAVTITTDVTGPTNLTTIPFTLQFSEQVTGFVIGDITTTAGTIQNISPALSPSATSYTFDVTGLADEDSLVVSIAAGAVADADNNLNDAFSTTPITIDTTAPTVSSQSATTAITIELGTTEPVYGTTITPADFTISDVATGATVTAVELINGSSTITLTLSAPITESDTPLISYTPGTNRITDAAGNQLATFTEESITDNFDPTMPAVTITTAVTDPTNLTTIPFTLQFSEQVTGFVIGDITTTAGTIQNISPALSPSATSYTFDVTGLADEDSLVVSVAAGAVADADNNLNDAFSTTPITIDTTAPTVSSQSATTAITIELGTTEPVYGTDITPADFTISDVATGATVTAVELINGSSTITLTLSAPITESDTPLISYTPGTNLIIDAATNQLATFSNESITDNFDPTMPAVTITTAVTDPTNLTTIPFTLQFSEQVTGFVIGDIATTAGTIQNISPTLSPSATSYTFDVTGLADEDSLVVSIAAGAVADADNNLNDAFSTTPITIDTTAPTVSSQSATTATTVELGTTEPVYGTAITPTDFTISDVATGATVTAVELINGSSTITLTLSAPITESDTPLISYTPGTNRITDAATNQLATFSNESITDNFDPTMPAVTITTAVTSPTNLTTIPFTLQFSEQVTGFVIGDITTTAGTIQNISPTLSPSATSYTFDVTGLADEDSLVVSVAAGAVADADNNLNDAFSTTPIIIDTTAPTVSSQSATTATTVELGTTEPVFGNTITPTDFTISDVATGATVTAVELINGSSTITLTLSAPITESDTPLISYTPGTNRITDAATNQLATFSNESITDNFDPTMPAVTITTAVTSPTNLTTIPFTLQFSEQVTGFVIGDITTTAGTIQNISPTLSPSATSYTFDVTGLADEDSLVVSIAAGAVADADNNLNDAFSTTPIIIDTTAPTVSSQSATTATTVELGTTEPVFGNTITPTDFTISDVATGATVTAVELINGSSTITLTLSAPITDPDTPLISYIPGTNRITDAAGNQLAAFTEESITDNFDPTMPAVTITTAVTDPTNLTTIPFTLQFSEQVTGFVIGDITTTAGTIQNISPALSPSATSYTFDVTGLADEDSLVVSVAAGAVADADNNLNDAFSTTPITIDTTAPTVSSQSATTATTVELGTTEPVFGNTITPTDFTISDVATGATVTAVELINGSSTITLTLSAPITGSDTPLISYTPGINLIIDAAGNQLATFSNESITDNFDPTRPAVTITTAVTSPTNLTTIPFTLQFSEQVTGFVIGDITTTAGTIQNLSQTPSPSVTSYTFDVTGLADEDSLVVSIAAGAVADADNNVNNAFSTTPITIDTTAPTVSSQSATTAITIELGTTEPVYGTAITPTDFTISDVATGATVTAVELINGSSTITLTLSAPITESDTPLISYTPGTNRITDAATNQLATFSNESITDNFDPTMPAVTITTAVTSPTNLTTIPFTLQFSEQVTGFVIGDIATTAGTIQNLSQTPSPSVTSYTFDVTGLADEDSLVVSIAAGAVADADNNLNDAFSTEPITIDTTAPAVSSASATTVTTVDLETTEPVYGNIITPTDFTISDVATGATVTAVELINGSSTITLTLSAPIIESDTPLISYTPGTNRITDAATNQLTTFSNKDVTNTLDPTTPVVIIATTASDPTNVDPVPFTIIFSETVTGFAASDITISSGTVQNISLIPSQSVTSYTFTVAGSADGATLSVSMPAGMVQDTDGNVNAASNTVSVSVDRTAPTVTAASVVDTSTIRLVLSELVFANNNVAPSDFTITGVAGGNPTVTAVTITNNTDRITLTLSPSISGSDIALLVSYTPSTNRITDAATNQLASFNNKDVTNILDPTTPVVTITTTASDPTNAEPVPFTITFSEAVTGFAATDITVSSGTVQNISPPPPQSATSYTFTVAGSADGAVLSVNMPANVVQDTDGNANAASNTVSVSIDRTAPTVTAVSVVDTSTIRLVLSELVFVNNNVAPSDFTITGVAGGNPTVTAVTITNNTDKVTLTLYPSISGSDIALLVSYTPSTNRIADAATNQLASFNNKDVTNILDPTTPVVTIATDVTSPTNAEPVPFTITFSEAVTGFAATDITVSSGTVQNISPTPSQPVTSYTFTVAGSADGAVLSVNMPANVVQDTDGNANAASNTVSVSIDRTAPTVTAASVVDTSTIRLVLSELVFANNNVAPSDFTITGVAGGNPTVTAVTITNNTDRITLTLSPSISGSDIALLVSYTPSTNRIADAATNQLASFNNKDVTNILDPTTPVVTITTTASDPTNAEPVPFTITFSEAVTGFAATDITVSSGTVQNISPPPPQSATSYTFTVAGSADGAVLSVSMSAGMVQDTDGNANAASNSVSVSIDRTAPTVSSTSATTVTTVDLEITEPVYGTSITPTDFTITGVDTPTTVTAIDLIDGTNTLTLTLSVPITGSDTPLVSYTPGTNRIADAATNQLAAFSNLNIDNNFDPTIPAVTITTAVTDPTNLTTIPFTLQFTEQVMGFVIGDITTTAGTVQNISPAPSQSATSYTFDVSGLADEDNLVVSIAAGAVTDADNNVNNAFSTESITIDTTAPTVSSQSATTTTTVQLETTEPVYGNTITPTDFTISDVATGATVTAVELINGSSTITLTLSAPITGSDTPLASYTPGTNRITDAAENQLAAFSNLNIDNNFDPTIPAVTITTTVTSPTNLTTIPFTLQFTEQVTGFVIGDITATAGTVQNISPTPSQSATSYTFDITGLADEDNLVVSIAAGAVTDADNNVNNAFSTEPITIDTTAPTVSSVAVTGITSVTLLISEPVFGENIPPTDFVLSDVAAITLTVSAVDVSNSAITLTLDAPLSTTIDTFALSYSPSNSTLNITDAAGNALESFDDQLIGTPPVVSLSTSVTSPTNLATIPFTARFSEYVTGFDAGDVEKTSGTVQNFAFTSNDINPLHIIGQFGTNDGEFDRPSNVALGGGGSGDPNNNNNNNNIYISDTDNNRIQIFYSNGTYRQQFGNSDQDGAQPTAAPKGIAVNSTGYVYLVDSGNHRISIYDDTGMYIDQFGGSGTEDGEFDGPTGIALDTTTNSVYVSDSGNNRIQVFDGTGAFIREFGSAGTGNAAFDNPTGIAFDTTTNSVYVSDSGNNRIQVFNSTGGYLREFGSAGTGDGQFDLTGGIALYSNNNNNNNNIIIYVADTNNNRIQVFDSNGTYITQFGADDTTDNTPLDGPTDIALDSNNIYVTDTGNHRFHIFTLHPVYTFDITNPASPGTLRVTIPAGAAQNVNSVDNVPSNTVSLSVGIPAPPVSGRNGSGDGESIPPSLTTSFDDDFESITINHVGISPTKFKNNYVQDPPVSVGIGTSTPIQIVLYENLSWDFVSHVELCINKLVSNNQICDSDTKIIWDQNYGNNIDNSLEIIDPNNLINDANTSVSLTTVNRNVVIFDFDVEFADTMGGVSDLQIYGWDTSRNALVFTVENAFEIVPDYVADVLPKLDDAAASDDDSSNTDENASDADGDGTSDDSTNADTPTDSESASDESSTGNWTKDQLSVLKKWAGYDAESASDVDVLSEFGIKGDKIPSYIKQFTAWIINDEITRDEFVDVLQYLKSMDMLSDSDTNNLPDAGAPVMTKGPGTVGESELMYEQLKSRLDQGKPDDMFDFVDSGKSQIFSKIVSFGDISMIEFANYGTSEIKTITLWLDDSSFVSFKPMDNWSSPFASEKSITFVSANPLKTNDDVTFGLETVSSYDSIQWEALDKDGTPIESGVTISEHISS